MLRFEQLAKDNLNEYSLDTFLREQEVTECWRCVDGCWKLLPIAFTEHWDLNQLRENAAELLQGLSGELIACAAFDDDVIAGYISVGTEHFGSRGQYVQLVDFQVSQPYRGQKIGKRLFSMACDIARQLNAERLYISSHSSKESQAAYRALGCVLAEELNERLAELEPCDVQLEFRL